MTIPVFSTSKTSKTLRIPHFTMQKTLWRNWTNFHTL